MDSAAVDAMLGDEKAMSDPAVMGNVMNGLLSSLGTQPAAAEKKEKVDVAAVSEKTFCNPSFNPFLIYCYGPDRIFSGSPYTT